VTITNFTGLHFLRLDMGIEAPLLEPIDLLPIAIAVHIIAGVVAATGHLRRRYEHDVHRRTYYESLADDVAAALPWIHALRGCRSHQEVDKVHPPIEVRMAAVFAPVYLPTLAKPAARLTNSLIRYRAHLLNCCSDDRLSDRLDASVPIVESVTRHHPELLELRQGFLDCRLALEKAIANEPKPGSHLLVRFAMFDIGAALRQLPLLGANWAKRYRLTVNPRRRG